MRNAVFLVGATLRIFEELRAARPHLTIHRCRNVRVAISTLAALDDEIAVLSVGVWSDQMLVGDYMQFIQRHAAAGRPLVACTNGLAPKMLLEVLGCKNIVAPDNWCKAILAALPQ